MRTQVINNRLIIAILIMALLMPLVLIRSQAVNAAQITGRKVTLSNSAGAATGVTYTFDSAAMPTTGTPVRSVAGAVCTTASGACSAPAGFTGASANLTSQPVGLGCTSSWTDDSNAGNLRITHASCAVNPSGAATIVWDTVTNPTAQNSTYFIRFTTYSDSAYSSPLDTGVVAVSTAQQITVSASVDETLTFCSGTSGVTTSSCSGVTGSTVSLGTLTSATTGSGVSQLGVGTNAGSGYVVTINGTTLTSGGNTISALASQTASSQGNEQFGVNLRDNATPNVGTDVDGSGDATPTANYNTVDQFRFVTGDSIASDAESDLFRRFHVAYMANVTTATEPGTYQSVLTYIATATF